MYHVTLFVLHVSWCIAKSTTSVV